MSTFFSRLQSISASTKLQATLIAGASALICGLLVFLAVAAELPFVGNSPGMIAVVALSAAALNGVVALIISAVLAPPERAHPELQLPTTEPAQLSMPTLNAAPLVEAHIARAIARVQRSAGIVAVLALRVDQFEELRSAMGPGTVEALENEVLLYLSSVVRKEEAAIRLRDDTYLIVLEYLPGIMIASGVAERIRTHFDQVLSIAGENIAVSLSIGVAENRAGLDQAGALLRGAEVALAEAFSRGGDQIVYYHHELDDIAHARAAIARDFRSAISDRQSLALVFQPVYDLSTGSITAAEALLRWNHDIHGRLSAPLLLDIAKETGLLASLTRWELERVVGHLKDMEGLPISLNINANQLEDNEVTAALTRFANSQKLKELRTRMVLLEVDASGMDSPAKIKQLSGSGFGITFDGVPPDSSDGGHLDPLEIARLSVESIKFDARAMPGIFTDAGKSANLRNFVEGLHAHGVAAIAKNVETEHVSQELVRAGIFLQQGRFLSPPVTAPTLRTMVNQPKLEKFG